MPNMIELYCKIPDTDITRIFNIRDDLTISELLHYINTKARFKLPIPSRYSIEVVDAELGEMGHKIENSDVETIRERYKLFNNSLVCYIRII